MLQVISAIDDMKTFDQEDAQLNLTNGKPRFYIMRLPAKPSGLSFTSITHHKEVTQCLGGLTPHPWCVSPSPSFRMIIKVLQQYSLYHGMDMLVALMASQTSDTAQDAGMLDSCTSGLLDNDT